MEITHKTTIFVTAKGRMSAEKCWMFFHSLPIFTITLKEMFFPPNFTAAAGSQLICTIRIYAGKEVAESSEIVLVSVLSDFTRHSTRLDVYFASVRLGCVS
jgi:hypothetical protein